MQTVPPPFPLETLVTTTADTVLVAENLTKVYGTSSKGSTHIALDGFDLQVRRGEFLGIMGPSGSGKTTLLNILSTIDVPTSGRVCFGADDLSEMQPHELARFRRRELGFVFQDFNLLDSLSVRENILLPLVLDRFSAPEMRTRLATITETMGITAILDRRPYEISGGQQQRVAICRAMIHRPALLFADEPTGNLDSAAAQDVMNALRDINVDGGATVLMVTHDPFAASYCTRVAFIRDGRAFTELHRGANRKAFFQRILDTLSLMGGSFDDVRTTRP